MSAAHDPRGSALERLIFGHRLWVIALCGVLSLLLFYQASLLRPSASFEKMIPLQHPFIQRMLEHRDDLANLGNTVRIGVAARQGDMFDPAYLETLRQVHDEAFYLPGAERAGLRSLWSPGVRWNEVTEAGFAGGTVIPHTYDGSPDSLQQLRDNLLRSGEVGRLVANDLRSSIVEVPLLEAYPDPQSPGQLLTLDYQRLSQQMESRIRQRAQAQNPNVEVHITGFAKKVGDLIDGLAVVTLFFAGVVLITLALLYGFTRCLRSTVAVLATTLMAVVWQLGLMHLAGLGLDPYSMLVPFLIFAIGISHGVQKINVITLQAGTADSPLTAARQAFAQLFWPGMVAILVDAIGFASLLVIDIGVIRELALGASMGVAVIILSNLIVLPVAISYVGISHRAIARRQRDAGREQPFWRGLAHAASPRVAPWSLGIALLALGAGLWYGQRLQVGDLDPGAPELRPSSRYNQDNAFMLEHYSTRSDVLVVMVKTAADGCSQYATLAAMDELMAELEGTPGVQSTQSLVTVAKQAIKGLNEGNLKWQSLSRNQALLDSAVARADGLYNSDCSLAPLLVLLDDHKADTLERVVQVVQTFAASHDREGLAFMLAAGNAGIEAAINEVIKNAEWAVLLWVYGCVGLMCLVTFRSLAAMLCIVLPLLLTSVLGNALMAWLGIGVKVATLPVVALGVGIGVDYGIYLYSRLQGLLRSRLPLQQAYYQALRSTGRAVLFTGLCLAAGVATWVFSPIKFQADMGLMLTFLLLWNMLGALWLLPALAWLLHKR
ncbi:efflux RND transporter permease subunit [Pseudomonas sp. nanlin1]|uniref:efflux RND transporter permease subunit n=1 Tax=Pseudomonas sp. nanlin1 TaxID=3040605 RepID=UPI00388DA915